MAEAGDRVVCILSGSNFSLEKLAGFDNVSLESPVSSLSTIKGAAPWVAQDGEIAARITGPLEQDPDQMFQFLSQHQAEIEQAGVQDVYFDWITPTAFRFSNIWISETHVRTIAKLDIDFRISCQEEIAPANLKPEIIR